MNTEITITKNFGKQSGNKCLSERELKQGKLRQLYVEVTMIVHKSEFLSNNPSFCCRHSIQVIKK
jgi:hypothetical protein